MLSQWLQSRHQLWFKWPSSFVAQISPALEDMDLTLTFMDQFTLHTFRRTESKRAWSDEQSWPNIVKEVGVQKIDHQMHVTNITLSSTSSLKV